MLSVAVITYNQEDYIAQTLDSILSQEHDYKYEIVIGEDNSSDNTKKIIKEYAAKYPEIIKPLYNNPNKGLIRNYFNVIQHCQGKYIMECAGDDYWLPGKVKKQIDFMEANPDVGMCYSKAKFWNERTKQYGKNLIGSDIKSFENLLNNGNVVPALTVCFRKILLEKYIKDVSPLEKSWLMEDYPMWLYFTHEGKVKFIDDVTAVYRVLDNSASHNVDVEKQFKFEKNTEEIKCFFSNLYSTHYELLADEMILFRLYVNLLTKEFSNETAKKVRLFFKCIKKRTLKTCILFLSSYSRVTWYALKKIRGV